MTEKQIESMIDHELLNDIQCKTKCTQFQIKYSKEIRIEIYLLNKKYKLSYGQIIEYCDTKYGESPSRGHIRKLILDGEKHFFDNKENVNDKEESGIDKQYKTDSNNLDFDLQKTKIRISELMKDKLTTCERDELIVSIISMLQYIDKMQMHKCA